MAAQPAFGRIANAFARLTESEKRLVTLLGAVATLFLVVGLVLFINGRVDAAKKRLAMRNEGLVQLDSLKAKYDEAVQLERKQQGKLAANAISLFSVVRNGATETGLAVPDLQERRTPVKDSDVVEVSVDVKLKEVSVDRLQAFLEKLEGKRADQPVKVSKLVVKARFDNPELLEASLGISTWKTEGKAGAAAPPDKPGATP
jgi:type II secretory pathway component PulM